MGPNESEKEIGEAGKKKEVGPCKLGHGYEADGYPDIDTVWAASSGSEWAVLHCARVTSSIMTRNIHTQELEEVPKEEWAGSMTFLRGGAADPEEAEAEPTIKDRLEALEKRLAALEERMPQACVICGSFDHVKRSAVRPLRRRVQE